jgi:hypothetical protein
VCWYSWIERDVSVAGTVHNTMLEHPNGMVVYNDYLYVGCRGYISRSVKTLSSMDNIAAVATATAMGTVGHSVLMEGHESSGGTMRFLPWTRQAKVTTQVTVMTMDYKSGFMYAFAVNFHGFIYRINVAGL